VQFLLHQGDHRSIQEWIKVGAVDFGFITPAAVTGLQTITIKDGAWLAVLPEDHKLASNGSVNLEELVKEPFILLEEGNFSEPLEAFHSCNLEPNIKFCIHDDFTIMTMVEAGLGISILPELVLRRTNYRVALRPVNPPIIRTIAIGFKDKSSLPIASKYFIEYLVSNIEKLP
jgi:DNA-binding transcriptional LysR family regulator